MKDFIKYLRYLWHTDLNASLLASINNMNYVRNEALKNQEIVWEDFSGYGYVKRIHELLKLYKFSGGGTADWSVCRVGGNADGGYVMAYPFSEQKILYSIGVGRDVTFDYELAKKGYQVYQYDHTVKRLPQQHNNFHWKKIGITGGKETGTLRRLDTLLKQNGHSKISGMILKMDVEGAEWPVFDNINEETLNQFDQIVLELHYLFKPGLRKSILRGLENLTKNHAAIHIHGCNYSFVDYCNDMITPNVLEVTLVKKTRFHVEPDYNTILPDKEDRPDNPNMPDIWLGRWNHSSDSK